MKMIEMSIYIIIIIVFFATLREYGKKEVTTHVAIDQAL